MTAPRMWSETPSISGYVMAGDHRAADEGVTRTDEHDRAGGYPAERWYAVTAHISPSLVSPIAWRLPDDIDLVRKR